MAAGGLAKLKLELEIDGDKVVVTGLERVDSAVDQLARRTKTATEQMAAGVGHIETATGRMAAGMSSMIRSMFDDMTGLASGIQTVNAHIFSLIAAAGMIAAPFLVATATIKKGVEVVDDFALSNIQIAAQITQMQGPKDVVEHYRKASEYAAVLSLKIQEMDANSLANNKGLMAMTQTMAMQGVLLDVNNRKQVDAATALSNAIAAYTKGQDQQVQFYQETRSLMSGQVDMHAQVSRAIDQAIKQEGKYKDGLKEVVELGKQHGDLLERLQPYLVGMNAATADINKTWSAATSSMETTISLITRAGFAEIYRDAVDWLQQGNTYLRQHATEIGGVIKTSWRDVKGLIEGSVTLLQVGIGGSLPILQAVGSEVKFITKGIAEFFDLLRLAPGLLVPLGVAAFYAVGGLAAFEAGYVALTGVIAASMTTNPIGWLALGITAIAVAARPAINYLDQLLQKYSGLAEAQQNAATADANWENEKKRQRRMYEEGGRNISPGMMKELGLVKTPTFKPAPTLGKETFEKFDINSATNARLLSAQKQTEQFLSLEKYAADADLAILKEWHEKGLISQKVYNDSVYDVKKSLLDKEIATQEQQVALRLEQNRAANAALLKSGATEKNGVITVHTAEENKLLTHAWEAYGKVIEAQTKLNDLKAKSNDLDAAKPLQVYKDEVAEKKALNDATLLSIQMQLDSINAQEKLNQLTTGDAATKKIDLLQQQLELERLIYEQNTKVGPEADYLRMKQLEAIQKTNQSLLDQQRILSESTATGGMIAGLKEYARNAKEIGGQMKSAVTGWFSSMEDALVNFVRKGKLSFQSLTDSIISDLARIAIRQMITAPLAAGLAGIFTTTAAAAAPAVMTSAVAGGLPTTALLSATLPAAMGASVAKGAMLGTSTGIQSGLAAIAPYLGVALAGYAAYQFGKSYFSGNAEGSWNNHTTDQKVALAVYSSMTLGLGLVVDKLTKGALFGTNWQTKASGLSLGVGLDGIDALTYIEQSKKKGFFGGSKSRTNYSAIDDLLQDFLVSQLDSVFKGIKSGSSILGGSGDLTGFTSAAKKVSLSGLDAEGQQKAISAYFKGISDEAIKTLYANIDDYAKLGESATDTFQRLTSSLKLVNNNLAILNVQLNELSLTGAAVADKLVQELGGLQAATTAFKAYYDSDIFTQAEKDAIKVQQAQAEVNDTFKQLGLSIPQTNDAFKELLKYQLSLGESGAEAAAALLKVGPAFGTVTSAVQTMVDQTSAAQKQLIDNSSKILSASVSTASTLLGAMKTILTGPLANLSPTDAYLQAKQQWATADATNAGERSQAFLEASKSLNASGPVYAADRQAVLDKLGQLAQTAPTLSFVEQQIQLLGEIKTAVESGDAATVQALGITFNAAQIDMGLANNQLSLALQSIQSTLNTPITSGTASPAIKQQIAAIQATVNTTIMDGTAKGAMTAQIASLQTALNAPIIDSSARVAIAQQISALQSTLNTTIMAGTAKQALTAQVAAMQSAFNTPVTTGSATAAIQQQIASLQTALNNNGQPLTGSAADSVNANIHLLQLALNGTISSAVATQGISNSYNAVQGALNGTINGTTAANYIAAQSQIAQAALNGTITGSTAAASIGQQAAIIQAAANGAITGGTAAQAFTNQYAVIQFAANKGIDSATASSLLSNQYSIIQLAANKTISGQLAASALSNQYGLIQAAANGTITGTQAAAALSAQYNIIQQAANGGISAATAQSQIQSQYAAVTNSLSTGVGGALTSISDALTLFTKSINDSASGTATGLANFTTAMEIMQTYPTKLAAYNTRLADLKNQYISGVIDSVDYSAQSQGAYSDIKSVFDKGVSAGLTTLTAPTTALPTSDMNDSRMQNKIKYWLSEGAIYQPFEGSPYYNFLQMMSMGKLNYSPLLDIAANGKLDGTDAALWQQIADGSLKWSSLGLPAFADGGVTNKPSIFGEAGWEAAVPLKGGRYIPVEINGSADNKETVAELKQLVKQQAGMIKTLQAGFAALVEGQKESNKSLKTVESGATLAKRAA